MSKRRLAWARALDDLRRDRGTWPMIREDRLRTTAGLRGTPYQALSKWRGLSGRSYVVVVRDVAELPELIDRAAVAIMVRRAEDGIAAIVAVGTVSGFADLGPSLTALGATEIHLHFLAETEAARRAVIRDLQEPPVPAMQQQVPRPAPIVTVG